MGTTSNRKHPSVLMARTASLSMALALSACSEKQEKSPSNPGAASAFKDSQAPQSPAAPTGTPTAQQASEPPANDARTPEQLFLSLGCPACHGAGRPFAASLANSREKPPEVVAMWILDPQKVRPGTMMPSYTGRLSTAEALALAQWIKAGNPAP
ncbi:c-type cytochrome [Archangium lansingense]|uniref:Cytochrome c n=1 Tax=Archangium lansingense TaxID=2995310 RepID=A0ABT3ZWC1_9BACT|nr:cytochrome c [Archangium lansinium]MCY1073354.1 cytochrome c [Archangium lansinium]